MKDFLIICGSNVVNSQNHKFSKLIDTELGIKTIYLHTCIDVPFITNDLLAQKFFPVSLNLVFDSIYISSNLIFIVPDHNQNFNAFFKNIFDWLTVKDRYFLKNKTVYLISITRSLNKERGISVSSKYSFESAGCKKYSFVAIEDLNSLSEIKQIISNG